MSLEALTTPLTTAEAKASIYQVLVDLGMPTTSWKPGAVVRTIIALVAVVVAACSQMVALIGRSGFRELSRGAWLDVVGEKTYNVTRRRATFGTTTWIAQNGGGGVYLLDPGDLVLLNPVTRKTYFNTEAVLIDALAADVPIAIQATEAGTDSNAGAGEITQLVTQYNGVTGTNPEALIAQDEESDAEYRARQNQKLDSLSPNGPQGAYEYVAKQTTRADGTSVGVSRVKVSSDSTTGEVDVVCAKAASGLDSTELALVAAAIQSQAVPIGITATVRSATPVTLNVTNTVWIYSSSGMTTAQVQAAVLEALQDWIPTQPIGGNVIGSGPGKIFVDDIRARLIAWQNASGDRVPSPYVFRATIATPAADVTLADDEIAVLGTVTTNVVLV